MAGIYNLKKYLIFIQNCKYYFPAAFIIKILKNIKRNIQPDFRAPTLLAGSRIGVFPKELLCLISQWSPN